MNEIQKNKNFTNIIINNIAGTSKSTDQPDLKKLGILLKDNFDKYDNIIGLKYDDVSIGEMSKKKFPNTILCIKLLSVDETGNNIIIRFFKNKSIHISGFKILGEEKRNIDYLKKIIIKNGVFENQEQKKSFKFYDFRVCNIISKYSVNFPIDRYKLSLILKERYSDIQHRLSAGYSGLLIYWFYNKNKKVQNGMCECKDNYCILKSKSHTGDGPKNCKKITLSIFAYKKEKKCGYILVLGSINIQQINAAYSFVNNIIMKEYDNIIMK